MQLILQGYQVNSAKIGADGSQIRVKLAQVFIVGAGLSRDSSMVVAV